MQLYSPQGDARLRTLFDLPHLGFVVEAMCAGNSPAQIWVDDIEQPRSAFIWDTTHSLYFGGEAENAAFNESLKQFLAETLLPEAQERQLGVFKLYTNSDSWAKQLPVFFAPDRLSQRERTHYALDKIAVPQIPPTLPDGFQVVPIKREILIDSRYKNANRVLEEIESCWNSIALFWANGFGFCVVSNDDEIACWCTAEYVSEKTCGVGIETVEAFQRRGLATWAATAFAQHCVEQGWTAHWDAWSSNVPSVKAGENAGFRKASDYAVQIYMLS
jgi:hypothetical protein